MHPPPPPPYIKCVSIMFVPERQITCNLKMTCTNMDINMMTRDGNAHTVLYMSHVLYRGPAADIIIVYSCYKDILDDYQLIINH